MHVFLYAPKSANSCTWDHQLISINFFPPFNFFPPLIKRIRLIRGGKSWGAQIVENFWGFWIKIAGKTLWKRSKNTVFAEKIVFSKRKISKFSRLRRGYTPSNPLKFRACGAAIIQPIIQHINDVETNYPNNNYSKAIIQKIDDVVQTQLFKSLMTLFKNNYSKILMTRK